MLKPAEHNPFEHLRVLVLEDEVYIRQIICRMLRQIGFGLIDEAADGADGFRELLRVRPDVILCDIHMAPIDGITFLKKLRALRHEQLSVIPVIFLTSDIQKDTVLAAKELRVDGYLAKPVSPKILRERIEHVLFHRHE